MRAVDLELPGYELRPAQDDGRGAPSRLRRGRRLSGGLDVDVVVLGEGGAGDPTRLLALRAVEGVVPVVDAGVAPTGQPYLVVERWSTGDLGERLAIGPLSAAETVVVGRVVGRALIGAHELGIAHGALAAGAVVFTDDGRPRLTGFGLNGSTPAPDDDLAALGRLLLACLDRGDGAHPSERYDVPDDVAEVVGRASSTEAGERRPSLGDFVDDLDQLAFRHGWMASRLTGVGRLADDVAGERAAAPAGRSRRDPTSRRRRVVLTGATIVVAALVGGWLVTRWRADTATGASTASPPTDVSDEAPAEVEADADVAPREAMVAARPAAPTPLVAEPPLPTALPAAPTAAPTTAPTTAAATAAVTTTTAPAGELVADELTIDVVENDDGTGGWQLLEGGRLRPFGEAAQVGSGQLLVSPETNLVALVRGGPEGGLRVVSDAGRVIVVGDAEHHGDLVDVPLRSPIVDAGRSALGLGYVLLGADGGLFSFGDAHFRGSAAGMLDTPAVGLVVLDDSHLVVSSGGGWVRLGGVVAQGLLPAEAAPVRSVQRLGDQLVVSTTDDRTMVVDLAAFGV